MIFDLDKKITVISLGSTRPSFNLAAEEVFFKRREGSYALLWRNSPSIIIGKNQNAFAELDTDYAEKNSLPVIRRTTGGGAVYHDLGNLNFSFIFPHDGMADFKAFLSPVVGYLRSLGLNADFSGRNDILVGGKKVSGNAQASSHGRVLLHGTLLFSADMSVLSSVLKPNPLKLSSKGIASVRSRVANISELLETEMSIEEFRDGLFDYFASGKGCVAGEISEEDTAEAEALEREKYALHEWNFGAAPDYTLEKSALIGGSTVTACFNVSCGKITAVRFFGDYFGERDISELESLLVGLPHERQEIKEALHNAEPQKFIFGADAQKLSELF